MKQEFNHQFHNQTRPTLLIEKKNTSYRAFTDLVMKKKIPTCS